MSIVVIFIYICMLLNVKTIIKKLDNINIYPTNLSIILNTILYIIIALYLRQYDIIVLITYSLAFVILYIVATIDKICFEIPNKYFVAIFIIGFFNVFIGYKSLQDSLKGFLIFLVFFVFILVTESISKSELLGGGDLKLFLSLGFFLGFWNGYLLLFISHFIRVLEVIYNKVFRNSKMRYKNSDSSTEVAFGPYIYMAFSLIIATMYLIDSYIKI